MLQLYYCCAPFFTTFDVTFRRQLSFRPVFKLAILRQRCFLSIPHNISTKKNMFAVFHLSSYFTTYPPPPPNPPYPSYSPTPSKKPQNEIIFTFYVRLSCISLNWRAWKRQKISPIWDCNVANSVRKAHTHMSKACSGICHIFSDKDWF